MRYELTQSFYFEAAHTLKREIDAAGSRRIHGHTYLAEATVAGTPDAKTGMVVDLAIFRRAIEQVRTRLDHHFLDEIEGLGPATLENLCRYVHTQLARELPHLASVRIARQASGDSCVLRSD